MKLLKLIILISLFFLSAFCFSFSQTFTLAQVEQFKKAAALGVGTEQYNLAFVYQHGYGIKQDIAKAKYWYLQAAKSSNANVRYKVGRLFETGQVFLQDYNKAIALYTYAANEGDPYAQNNLALMYLHGKGVEKNLDVAISWFEKSAESPVINAYVNLALIYQQAKPNHTKSIYWWKKAAEEDYPEAYFQLGQYYYFTKDYREAFNYYKKGADINHANAQLKLAMLYDKGIGTEKNIDKSVSWIKKSAEAGNLKAIELLKKLTK